MSKNPEILILAVSNIDLASVKTEIKGIRNNLKTAVNQHFITTNEKLNVDFNTLDNTLNDSNISSQITMLHYTGHSSDAGILVEKGGVNQIMIINSIKTLIETHKKFRFIFLNSCYSEEIAKQLVAVGVPYVLGTKSKVGDEDASKVASKFYEYLGINSFTIPEAYHKTKTYFFENPNDLNANGDFRSLTTSEEDENKNVWKLFFDENKLTDEQKNWTLIPKENLILSDPENADKLKFLCLYEEEKSSIYEELRSRLLVPLEDKNEDKKQKKVEIERVQNGIWNIKSGTFDRIKFLDELKKADFIIHFLTDSSYQNMIEKYIDFDDDQFKTLKHIHIPISGNLNLFQGKNWFAQHNILQSKIPLGITIEEISKKNSISNSVAFEYFFKESFENKISETTNPKKVTEILKTMPFAQVLDQFKNTETNKLFFTLIEGTKNCGALVMLKYIINHKNIDTNIELLKIAFKSEKGEKLIKTKDDIWKGLLKVLNLENSWISEEEYPKECCKAIYKRMAEGQTDTIIVFNQIDDLDLYEKEIINNFWNILKREFIAFEKFFTEKNPEKTINKQTFIFALNDDIEQVNFNQKISFTKDGAQNNKPEIEISLSPIAQFTAFDFNIWNEIKPLKQISFKNISPDLKPIYRKELIPKICELTNCNYLSQKLNFENLA